MPSRELRGSVARRSAEAGSTTTTSVAGGVIEVDKDTFWPFVKSATEENKVAVLDMYTQWCGPCKLMLPKVIALSETYDDVVFAKLDCNQENKPLAKELGVKTVPTFKIFKNGEEVAEIRGAKYDDLVKAIENARL
jgi:thioredoxin 1